MVFHRLIIVQFFLSLSGVLAADKLILPVPQVNIPAPVDHYYAYPQTNSQHFKEETVTDIFRWRICADTKENILVDFDDTVWEAKGFPEVNLPVQKVAIQMLVPREENECSVFSVDIYPWIAGSDGMAKVLTKGEIRINVTGDNGKIYSTDEAIPGFRRASSMNGSDTQYLILTNSELLPAAESIADLYNFDIQEIHRLTTEVALIDTISDTIRDYLMNRIEENDNLQYVLFLGDETVLPPMTITTYDPDIQQWIQRPSDDFYTSIPEFSAYPLVSTARLPVSELSDALTYTDRLRNYLLNPAPGNWKSIMTFLADDANKSGGNFITEVTHVANSNILYNMMKNLVEPVLIYGTEYTPVPGGGWLLQPQMTEDVLESVNSGISLINFIGHGSATTLADEKIILMDRDINAIHDPVGAIWVVGTCSFGWYDDEDSMTEALLASSEGASAVISTTFKVSVITNFQYLLKLFENIRDYIQGENDYRLGDLVRHSKEGGLDFWFHAFGDPAMPLPFPRKNQVIDQGFTSDIFQILEPFQLTLQPEFGSGAYQSWATIRGPEKTIQRTYSQSGTPITLTYALPGNPIYQGIIPTPLSFTVPLDMELCSGCTGSIHVYTEPSSLSEMSITYIDELEDIPIIPFFGDTDDQTGPEISVIHRGNSLKEDDLIFPPYQVIIAISDPSGVNLTGNSAHLLRYWVDEESNSTEFNHIFSAASPTDGTAMIQLPFEPDTRHSLTIEAWDNANNLTRSTFYLYASSSTDFKAELIYNWPNPFVDDTYFTFQLTDPARVSITVFTTNGRIIKVINRQDLSAGYNAIYWDGLDDRSMPPANGTYLYRLKAVSADGREFESIHKLSKVK